MGFTVLVYRFVDKDLELKNAYFANRREYSVNGHVVYYKIKIFASKDATDPIATYNGSCPYPDQTRLPATVFYEYEMAKYPDATADI